MSVPQNPTPLKFKYKNWRGEISGRTILPLGVKFAATEWHPAPAWLLLAFDLDKNANRQFVISDIISEEPAVQDNPGKNWLITVDDAAPVEFDVDTLVNMITSDAGDKITITRNRLAQLAHDEKGYDISAGLEIGDLRLDGE